MHEQRADLILMPHAWPARRVPPDWSARPTSARQQRMTELPVLYARALGVPVVFVNQVGPLPPSRRPDQRPGSHGPSCHRAAPGGHCQEPGSRPRVSFTVAVLPSALVTLTVTCWPGCRPARTAASVWLSEVVVPLTAVMTSPGRRPALAPGPPGSPRRCRRPRAGRRARSRSARSRPGRRGASW